MRLTDWLTPPQTKTNRVTLGTVRPSREFRLQGGQPRFGQLSKIQGGNAKFRRGQPPESKPEFRSCPLPWDSSRDVPQRIRTPTQIQIQIQTNSRLCKRERCTHTGPVWDFSGRVREIARDPPDRSFTGHLLDPRTSKTL